MVTDPTNQYRTLVYMLPQDVIDNTIKAYSFNATGYSAGAPEGRYFTPANGPNCIETASNSYGDCGHALAHRPGAEGRPRRLQRHQGSADRQAGGLPLRG